VLAGELALALLTLPVWLLVMEGSHLYTARYVARVGEEMRRILRAVIVGALLVLAFGFFLRLQHLSRLWVISLFVWVLLLLVLERTLARRTFRSLRSTGRLVRRVVIIGANDEALELGRAFAEHAELGYEVVGYLAWEDQVVAPLRSAVLGPVSATESVVERLGISGVVLAVTAVPAQETNRLVRRLTDEHIHVEISSALCDIAVNRFRLQEHDGHPVVYVEPTVHSGWRAVAKRAFDVAFAAAALVVTAPLLLVCAILIKLDSPGPVFFRQERVGRGGGRFQLLKLRSMTVDAEARKDELAALNEADGPLFKMTHDPRVTRVGRVLRRLSIDEIPQFWNVLRGEMSVVGPRPALASEMEQWSPELRDRLRVKPGITGSWQVSGRAAATFEQYQRLDLYYVHNWSLAHDVAIVARTIPAVVKGKGAA
jgi:exopolysaccharide biosynthesis polyprenyl glycosylphosphotransferase